MEQKTEASQAVDERVDMIAALSMCAAALTQGSSKRSRDIACEYACEALRRAALKAQPAPTEAAQGEDSARLECLNMLINSGAKAWPRSCLRCGLGPCQTGTDRARASAETGGVKA